MRPRWNTAWVMVALVFAAGCMLAQGQVDVLIPTGSVWKFLDNGSSPAGLWRTAAFDDSRWGAGPAQLGYGDNDEATVVGYGPVSTNKFVTTYFRRVFTVADATRYVALRLRLLRDDGAVVSLNGMEVLRSNLPTGPLANDSLALSSVGGADENTFYETVLRSNVLAQGMNVVAVEVHQSSRSSTDLSFDFELAGILAPMELTLDLPSDGAMNVPHSVTLQATVQDPDAPALTVTFSGRPAGPSPGPDFTLIALPDTQHYVGRINGGTPAQFLAQTDWIVRNKTVRNIAFVTQLGDCVEHGDNGGDDEEWRYATNAMYRLEDPATTLQSQGIPYGITVGNHDQSPQGNPGATRFYNQYFGESHFAGRMYYGGHCGTNNNNHFELFSASALDFIVVHLEYDTTPDAEVLAWANGLLQAYSQRRAIVVSHYLINAGMQASFGAQGQAVYGALKGNPNLFLMLCGHVTPEEGQRTDVYQGNTVYTLMSDYQSRTNGGNGWLRILEFSPSNNVIRVQTYSPTLDQYETDADSQFTLPYDMQNGLEPFTPIVTVTNVSPRSITSAVWTGLQPGTTYQWQVMAGDGVRSATSPIARFTTGGLVTTPGTDTDGDGMSDAGEVVSGTDPGDAQSVLRITSMQVVAGRVEIHWNSVPGRTYHVVGRQQLSAEDWRTVSDDLRAEGVAMTWSAPADSGAAQYFFRVEVVRDSTTATP